MPAFNRRFEMRRVAGLPLEAVFALLVSLVFGLFTIVLPAPLFLLSGVVCLASFAAALFVFLMGERWPFRAVWFDNLKQQGRITIEGRYKL